MTTLSSDYKLNIKTNNKTYTFIDLFAGVKRSAKLGS